MLACPSIICTARRSASWSTRWVANACRRTCGETASAGHFALNGYGRGLTFHLKIELLIEQCLHCFETSTGEPRFDCRWHRFEQRFMQIADAEAQTLEKALAKLESAMFIRDRRAA